ncbi:MAG: hypothetical protein QF466_07120 [Desulfobacterales bacterium]|jgi:hypothetical protein|nr:hypothetical protein [Desulfobacterales bacterium]MDP6681498.1 hypothetical protein [Desulfobacterales bacterium]MDP6808866.1 hypothetical protein [Desulfobacterales bacterium]|tara:strand:+ start:1259 stop:1600 length:342 start_codon:yes stop_codon:yes gene_type:complete
MELDTLKTIYNKKSEENEKLRLKSIERLSQALGVLKSEVTFEDAYIFGSLTKPHKFKAKSDIDIAFAKLERDKLFFAVSFLSRYLERYVNVIHLEDIHFQNKIIKEGIRWKKD